MKVLCRHGISKDAWNRCAEQGNRYYRVTECGFKYNLTEIASALGIRRLRELEDFIRIRRRYAAMYNATFADVRTGIAA